MKEVSIGHRPVQYSLSALTLHAEAARERGSIDTAQQLNTPKPALASGTMIQLHLVRDFGLQSTIKLVRPPLFPPSYAMVITMSNLEKKENLFPMVTWWQSG